MKMTEDEKKFILKAIECYWRKYNDHHEDSDGVSKMSEGLVEKMNLHIVSNNEVAVCSANQKPETCPKFKKLKLGCERCYCNKRTN